MTAFESTVGGICRVVENLAADYFPLDGDLAAGPLLLPGFPGIFDIS
jgi:hypothetical protein